MPNEPRENSHEKGVETFYSHGSKHRAQQAGGFLSFGYWEKDTMEYSQATENLVKFFLKEGEISNPEVILDVACGYGAESFKFYDALKPQQMRCIDITKAHIDFANKKAAEANLQNTLIFEQKDACRTGFADETFSHIVGIEGPAHFKTRIDFFRECYRLLKRKGELILTDITFNRKKSRKGFALQKVMELGAWRWHMPRENWVNAEEYCRQLKEAGFKIKKFLRIGDKVFPGFAEYNTRLKSSLRAIRTRGLPLGAGLTFISWLLGYGYRKEVIDYIFFKAVKE